MKEQLSRIEEELQEINLKKKFFNIFLFCACFLLVGRLWYLQVLYGEEFKEYSELNRLKKIKIKAGRGLILDRNKKVLVENTRSLDLTVTPQYITDSKTLAQQLSPVIQKDPENILNIISEGRSSYGPFHPVVVKKHLGLEQAAKLKWLKWDFPELNIQNNIVRHYPLKQNGAHIFGYIGEISAKQMSNFNKKYENLGFRFQAGDLVGQSGIEKIWEGYLKGTNGYSFTEVNAKNLESLSRIADDLKILPPVSGHTLVLTLDKQLQEATFKSFRRHDHIGPRHGSAILLKTNGEILSWLSYPSYDPNMFSKGIPRELWKSLFSHPSKPLRNKPIQDHYPPGSLFKPFVALIALENGLITLDTKIYSPEKMEFHGRTYHDYSRVSHGHINVHQAIERSANVFFYKLGLDLGINTIARYAKMFGFGKKTGIAIEGDVPGLIPDPKWKRQTRGEPWQKGETLQIAIGQSFTLVTPLQIALAYNAIVNSGHIVKPFLVKNILDTNDREIDSFAPEVISDLTTEISPENLQTIKEALVQVVHGHRGTARWWKVRGQKIGGKTGTSQVMSFSGKDIHAKCLNRPRHQRHHGWFAGFAPAEKPEVTVVVFTEHSCSGSGGSAPIARDILQSYFDLKKSRVSLNEKF